MSTEHSGIENFWRIAEAGDTRAVESVLAAGVDIDASNSHGMTALMRAASQGRAEMVRLLLKHGADPNRARNDKFTALVLASFFGHEEIVKILVEHGASIDATTRFGTSAQGWASARTFPDVAEYLKTTGVEHSRSSAAVTPSAADVSEPVIENPSSVQKLGASTYADAFEAHEELPNGPEPFEAFDRDAVEAPGESLDQPEAYPAIFAVAPRPFNRKRIVYAFATLLLAFALFAHLTLRNTHSLNVASNDAPPPTLSNSVTNSTDVMSSIEATPIVPSAAKVENLVSRNDVNNSYKKPEKENDATIARATRGIVSTSNSARKHIPEQQDQTVSVSQAPPSPAEPKTVQPKEMREAVLATAPDATAPATTAKPKPIVSRDPTPKMRPAPSTQLLTGTKGADKGREIRWP